MPAAAFAIVFLAGFIIMTPVGPVSTICIRRSLRDGFASGVAAGAGNALAVGIYASIGVAGSMLIPRLFAPFATVWHVVISVVLVAIAIIMWRSRPVLPNVTPPTRGTVINSFCTTLAIALTNPADIVLFAALFAGLGIAVHTPIEHVLFFGAIFAGGCTYWIALGVFLNRWRSGITTGRMVWLNRACASLMLVGAAASLISLARASHGA